MKLFTHLFSNILQFQFLSVRALFMIFITEIITITFFYTL